MGHQNTHQTFASGINNTDKHDADREPHLRVFHVKISKRDNPHFLYDEHACDSDRWLNAKQEEVHIEVASGYDKLESNFNYAKAPVKSWLNTTITLFTTVMRMDARQ